MKGNSVREYSRARYSGADGVCASQTAAAVIAAGARPASGVVATIAEIPPAGAASPLTAAGRSSFRYRIDADSLLAGYSIHRYATHEAAIVTAVPHAMTATLAAGPR